MEDIELYKEWWVSFWKQNEKITEYYISQTNLSPRGIYSIDPSWFVFINKKDNKYILIKQMKNELNQQPIYHYFIPDTQDLVDFKMDLIEKYDYKLPLISNQDKINLQNKLIINEPPSFESFSEKR